ncbi:MAG: hydantoinase/carbamoylase family amidase, partial [Gemmatimonadota bacterium]
MQRRDMVKALGVAAGAGWIGVRPQADWKAWRVNGVRVNGFLEGMSKIGRTPEGGYARTGFSDFDIEGRRYTAGLLEQAGLDVAVDAAGNIIGRRAGTQPGALPILFGSHVDSVPNGGNYDGPVGSLSAIEVATTLKERGYRNRHPLWVTVWADEENGLTGSRGFLGEIPPAELARPGRDGAVLAEQIKRVGGRPEAMIAERHDKGSMAGYFELHIEQGGNLDRDGINIGVVEGIVGIRAFDVTITGFANHAGTTPMDRRQNALLAAAELVLSVDRIVRAEPGRQVGTIGRLAVKPGAQNVIPGEVALTVELRDLSMDKLDRLWQAIRAETDRTMTRYKTSWAFVER